MKSCLYRPRSRMRVGKYMDAEVTWIPLRAERIRLAPYPLLIDSFTELSSVDQSISKGYIDEFFTLNELNILKTYLEGQRDIPVFVESFSIPCICWDDKRSMRTPLRCFSEADGWHSFYLDKRSKMNLPFDIMGYYFIK